MDQATRVVLKIGSWRVDPTSGSISQDDTSVRLDGRTMKLLVHLADRAGAVVSVDELLDRVWDGVIVTQDSVYQAVASLRRILGDDARQPTYIATVPRLGYRMVAPVRPWVPEIDAQVPDVARPDVVRPDVTRRGGEERDREDQVVENLDLGEPDSTPALCPELAGPPASGGNQQAAAAVAFTTAHEEQPRPNRRLQAVVAALCMALAVAVSWFAIASHVAAVAAPARSVAVMPFLDLTSESMNEEYFADGVTEELIDRLSKVAGMRVPSPASSFYFKDKNVTVADFARSLKVAYVLSGSIRKSGTMQRISARLVRASDGYIVWTHAYDQPVNDELKVQDDIASHVAAALSTSIR
jgi:transcriptional activator of cad operon